MSKNSSEMDQTQVPGDEWSLPDETWLAHQPTTTNEPSRAVQFINFQHPNHDRSAGQAGGPSIRSAIHSHVARTVHARRRRARTLAFQTTSGSQGGPSGQPSSYNEGRVALISARGAAPVSPLAVVGNQGRGDPFASFARPFSPTEHALLDHCRFGLHTPIRDPLFC